MAAIVRQIELCVPPEVAAGAYGIARPTYYQWLQRGRGELDDTRPAEPIYIEFVDEVEKAERKAEATLVLLAVQKARTTAEALSVLERRFGGNWRQKTEVHIDVRHILEGLANSPEELDAAVAEAERLMSLR
jgi:hypothetical protein